MKYAVLFAMTFTAMVIYALDKPEKSSNEQLSLFNNMSVAVAISGSAAKAACAETILDANKRQYITIKASEADLATLCHEIGLKVERKIKGMMK